MTGNDVALNTLAAVRLLNDLDLASHFLTHVGRVHLPAIAVGELLFGAANSAQHQTNLPRYRRFVEDCLILPVSRATAEIYANIRLELKSKGFPIPDSDIWIAASAMEHALPIVSCDKHFTYVAGLASVPLQ
jgi:tRNA(fMet)-specific endonuclease VapC